MLASATDTSSGRSCVAMPLSGTVLWERFLYQCSHNHGRQRHRRSYRVASSDSVHIMDLNGSVGGFEFRQQPARHWASDGSCSCFQGTDLRLIDLDGIVLASSPIPDPA